jgi:hypothetical protein
MGNLHQVAGNTDGTDLPPPRTASISPSRRRSAVSTRTSRRSAANSHPPQGRLKFTRCRNYRPIGLIPPRFSTPLDTLAQTPGAHATGRHRCPNARGDRLWVWAERSSTASSITHGAQDGRNSAAPAEAAAKLHSQRKAWDVAVTQGRCRSASRLARWIESQSWILSPDLQARRVDLAGVIARGEHRCYIATEGMATIVSRRKSMALMSATRREVPLVCRDCHRLAGSGLRCLIGIAHPLRFQPPVIHHRAANSG